MTRKPLPRAIAQKIESFHESNVGEETRKQRATSAGRRVLNPLPDEEAPALQPASPRDASEARPVSPPLVDRELPPAVSTNADPQAVQRRAEAKKIVDRHKLYAAFGGLFPLPIVNVAGVTAIIVRMI